MANNYFEKIKELMKTLDTISKGKEGILADGPTNPESFNYGHLDYGINDDPADSGNKFSDVNIDIEIENLIEQTVNFWNESVAEIVSKYKNAILNANNYWDAGLSFENTPYVMPNENKNGEKYEEIRTDEIEAVLKNSNNLDFTIELNRGIESLNNYLTRLLMPRYSRRVEIEDLNRNFWVIAQNLSALNEINGEILDKMISEITGLWENVYRLWQGILYLAERIDLLEKSLDQLGAQAAKTKIQLAYGNSFGQAQNRFGEDHVLDRLYKKDENGKYIVFTYAGEDGTKSEEFLTLTDTFYFKKGDSRYFGIYPYIEKKSISYESKIEGEEGALKEGWCCYFHYNKTISPKRFEGMSDEEIDRIFIKIDGDPDSGAARHGEFISILRNFGNRTASELLEDVRSKNYVLISPILKDEFVAIDNLTILTNPVMDFLQLYRDLLQYSIPLSSLGTIFDEQFIDADVPNGYQGVRATYLQWLIFTKEKKWSDLELVPQKYYDVISFLNNKGILNECLLISALEELKDLNTNKDIGTLKSILIKNGYDKILDDFYETYQKIVELFGFIIEEGDSLENYPYFNAQASSWEISQELAEKSFSKLNSYIDEWNRINSTDGLNSFSYCPTWCLFVNYKELFLNNQKSDFVSVKSESELNGKDYKVCLNQENVGKIPSQIQNAKPHIIKWDLISNEIASDIFSPLKTHKHFDNSKDRYDPSLNYNQGYEERLKNLLIYVYDQTFWAEQGQEDVFGNSCLYPWKSSFGVWFDFVKEPTQSGATVVAGSMRSFTSNHHQGLHLISYPTDIFVNPLIMATRNIYNVDVAVTFEGVQDKRFNDFIRYGKPYPSIAALLACKENNEDYLDALNNEDNFISYNDYLYIKEGAWKTDSVLRYIDGFIGFEQSEEYPSGSNLPEIDLIHYTPVEKERRDDYISYEVERSRISDARRIYYYGPTYIGGKKYSISSTDLINAGYPSPIDEGATLWKNHNSINNPAISISYLSSDTPEQQLSIFISKDITQNDFSREKI